MMLQWFGPSWGAPVCDPEYRVGVPVGEPCARCGKAIATGDSGVSMMHIESEPAANSRKPWHLDCFLESVGVKRRIHIHLMHNGKPMCELGILEWYGPAETLASVTCPACLALSGQS